VMLDRALAQRIATAVARGNGAEPPEATVLPGDLAAICADAQRRVVTYTGLTPGSMLPAAEAVERPDWIAANVGSMGALLDPVGERLRPPDEGGGLSALLRGPVRAATSAVVSA